MYSLPQESWFAVQVTPRSEKKIGSLLEYKGYQQFTPTYLSRKQWSDRTKISEEPLFPGYVFVRTSGTVVGGLICATFGVMRILSFGGCPAVIPDSEIEAVRKLASLGKASPTEYLSVGQKVQIKDGPFAGIVGTIRQIRNRACLIVSVELIAQSIYLDVDEYRLAPAAAVIPDKECA